jgi:membrane protein implicated in regulation of membrane protease activity
VAPKDIGLLACLWLLGEFLVALAAPTACQGFTLLLREVVRVVGLARGRERLRKQRQRDLPRYSNTGVKGNGREGD